MTNNAICLICNKTVSELAFKRDGYDFYECPNCKLLFVWPTPSNLEQIYKREYFKSDGKQKLGYTDYDSDKEPMKNVFIFYLKRFEKIVSGRKIFDIGAATGYFLDLAKRMGWQTAGIEISDYAASIANQRGHDVSCGQLPDIEIENKFDVITMWDVLEHVDNPQAYLKKVHNILPSGGLLAINTIDKNSWWAKLWGKRWHQINPPEHLYYYSKKNLAILLKKTGFEIIEIKKIGKKFSLAYTFKTLYNWQKLAIWQKLERFFNKPWARRFAVPINLRDNIFILAKKV